MSGKATLLCGVTFEFTLNYNKKAQKGDKVVNMQALRATLSKK